MSTRTRAQLLAWWNRVSEYPLIALSILFVAAYSWEVIGRLPSDGARHWWCEAAQNVTWALFILDYSWRLILAKRRWHYFSRHLFDLLVVALPFFRPLRLLRLVVLLRVLSRSAGANLRGQIALYVSSTAALLVYCGSLAVLQSERGHPGATITSFGDALWWSIVTMTTVGYGDFSPVTVEGRVIAGALMISGIAVIGLVTASFAAWLVGRVADEAEAEQAATRRDLNRLAEQLDRIERRLDALSPAATAIAPATAPPEGRPARRRSRQGAPVNS